MFFTKFNLLLRFIFIFDKFCLKFCCSNHFLRFAADIVFYGFLVNCMLFCFCFFLLIYGLKIITLQELCLLFNFYMYVYIICIL